MKSLIKLRGAIFKVFKSLGPGLLESVYEVALMHELLKEGMRCQTQVPLPVIYDGIKMDIGFRIDLLVDAKVIVEIKSVENLAEVHHKQVLTYLKLSKSRIGLLINFNVKSLKNGIKRFINTTSNY